MNQREQIEQAIQALQAQRTALGDAAVDAALAGLRQKLATLESGDADISKDRLASVAAPTPVGERKLLTVLFADVVGSMTIAEKLDPEEWKDIISGAHRCVSEAVCRYGGTIAQFLGDGVLAFFGAPITHEDDPIRAVRAGLAIQKEIREYAHSLAGKVENFQMRVGIHTGLVVVGDIGSAQHREYLAVGDAVNLAARLQSACAPGQVLVSNVTAKLIESTFQIRSLGRIAIKGKTEPMHAYAVQAEADRPAIRGIAGLTSPLVGREQELALLQERLVSLCDGEGNIVSVIGDAGIGKSRLMAEFRKRVTEKGVAWLEGRTLSFGQSMSYWPFQEILRTFAGITEDDSEAVAWNKLESQVKALCPDQTAEILPYLASLLSLEVREPYVERVKYLDGEALGKQIFLTSRRFFERLARARPTVLVFEDLHWVDASSARLVEHLLALVDTVPLMIVGVARPVPETPAAHLRETMVSSHADRYTEITLAPLTAIESETLVRNLLAVENLPPRMRGAILHKAEGNPFFLEEILRALIELGAFVQDPATARWRAPAEIESIQIPDTVQGVIMARVDRLDEDVKQVLRIASVIGRSFLYRVLRTVAQASEELDGQLSELQRMELIRQKRLQPELEYIFKHALAQEATYESILLQKRRELHARVARVIEKLFVDRLEEFYGLLAFHYARAEEWEKAQEYLFKAGDQAGRIAADGEALMHYRQALDAYARAFGDKWDPVQRASLERKMAEAFYRRGEHQQAIEYFQHALASLGYHLPTERWAVRRAIVRELIVQMAHLLWARHFVRPLQQRFSPAVEEETQIHYALGWITVLRDAELFALNALKRLNFGEWHGHGLEVIVGNVNCGLVFCFLSIPALASRYLQRAMALAEDANTPVALATARAGLGAYECWRGEFDRGQEHNRCARDEYRQAGDLHGLGLVTIWFFTVPNFQGEFASALQASEELARIGEAAGELNLICWGEFGQGLTKARMGQIESAIPHLKKSLELASAVPDHTYFVNSCAELARCCLAKGDLPQAFTWLDLGEARRFAHGVVEPLCVGTLSNVRAQACLIAMEPSGSKARPKRLKQARKACRAALKQCKTCRPTLPEAMRLQGTFEWLVGKPASAQAWWQRSLAESEKMGMRHDTAMTHLEMGRWVSEHSHLKQATAIFAEIGAERYAAQAREAVAGLTEQQQD